MEGEAPEPLVEEEAPDPLVVCFLAQLLKAEIQGTMPSPSSNLRMHLIHHRSVSV